MFVPGIGAELVTFQYRSSQWKIRVHSRTQVNEDTVHSRTQVNQWKIK